MTTGIRGRLPRLLFLLLVAAAHTGCVSSFIYFPDREVRPIPEQLAISPRWVFFEAQDGVRLSAWYLPQEEARGTILFFHGNGGNVSHYAQALAMFSRLGFGGFILDYRGYGQSEGTPSERGTYLDAEASWQYLVRALNIPPDDIVVWGRSLGGIDRRLACPETYAADADPGVLVYVPERRGGATVPPGADQAASW